MAFAYFIGGSREKDNRAIKIWRALFHFDKIYNGSGHSGNITFNLDVRMKLIPNRDGILGGFMLWEPTREAPLDVSRNVNRGSE